MKKLWVIIMIIFSLPAFAEDECLVSKEALTSPFDISSKQVKSIKKPTIKEHIIETALQFEDGVIVEYGAGGCVHYGYSFTYKDIKNFPQKLDSASAAIMKKYTAKTPLTEEGGMNSPVDLLNNFLPKKGSKYPKPHKNYSNDSFISYTIEDNETYNTYDLDIYKDGFSINFAFGGI